MSYNGSGTFVINTAGQPVVSGTVISSTAFNALTADLATGLSTAITKDGQTTPTANIPMGNNKITGLAVGTAATDAANLSQVQSTAAKLVGSVSGVDTITGTMSPTLAAYAAGQMFYFVAAGDNTGAVTLNLDGLGAKSVTRDGSVALAAGDIKSGEVVVVVYDGTRFQVVSQLNSAGNATFANVSITSALNVGGVATFSGGTANGVTYLNGSKALTSGSALVFDGTNLGIGTSSPTSAAGYTALVLNGSTGGWLRFWCNGSVLGGIFGNATTGLNIETNTATPLVFKTNSTTNMTLDSSGNLGLGVTPSAWGSFKAFEMQNGSYFATFNSRGLYIGENNYYNGSNWIYKGSYAASHYYQIDGKHIWQTAPSGTAGNAITFTEVARLTESANGVFTVGAGGSVGSLGTNYGTVGAYGSAGGGFRIYRGTGAGTSNSYFYGDGTAVNLFAVENIPLIFGTNNTERARITAGGRLLLGTTSDLGPILNVSGSNGVCIDQSSTGFGLGSNEALGVRNATSGAVVQGLWNADTSGDNKFLQFGTETIFTLRGLIDYNRGAGLTRYNTTSDYRAKDILGPVQNSGATIDALKVYEGQMKGATQSRPMLIAHEAQEYAPYAVTGKKDEINEDGTPRFQQMDVSSLVPLLIAEIQSLRQRVAQLEAK